MIAQRAAEQNQRAQRQQVGIDRPGQFGWAGLKIVREGREGDVDDRPVNESEARSKNGGGEGRTGVHARLHTSGEISAWPRESPNESPPRASGPRRRIPPRASSCAA